MIKALPLTFSLLLASIATSIYASNLNAEAQAYCQSMGDGLADEDAREMIKQCVEEQTQYDQEAYYPQDQDEATQYDPSWSEQQSPYEEEPNELDENPQEYCNPADNANSSQDADLDNESSSQDCLDQRT